MRIVGLTGGIASGKTTVSNYFQSLQVPVIDADVIARALTDLHQPAYQEILNHFGEHILIPHNKQINRSLLRQIIFHNSKEKIWLEQLLHPLINIEIENQIEQLKLQYHPYCLVVIPLLDAENLKNYPFLKDIIIVHTDKSIRQQRLMQRDQIQTDLADAMLDAHISDDDRLRLATHIVDNSGDIDKLQKQLQVLHQIWNK